MAKVGKKKSADGKVNWFVDYTFEGKRKKIYGFNNRDEALFVKAQIDLREADQKTGYKAQIPKRLSDAIKQYQAIVSSKKNPDTFTLEKSYFKKLQDFFDSKEEGGSFDGLVSSITLLELEQFRMFLRETKYSRKTKELSPGEKDKTLKLLKASTINRHFNTYGDFFTECRKWGFLTIDPTLDLEKLAEEDPKKQAFKPAQVALALKEFNDWALRIIYFITKTGARRGEACKLEPKDVHLDDNYVTLKSWKGGKYHEREFPLTDDLHHFMSEQMELVKKNKWTRFFVDDKGSPVQPIRLSTQMNRAAAKAGIPGLNLHALRHTIFSQLASRNVSLRKIQELAGHRSLTTTQKYLHSDRDAIKADLEGHEDEVNFDIFPGSTSPKGPEKKKGQVDD